MKDLKLNLKIPGRHNISNAMAVLAVARELKISDKITFKALSEFSGTWRRMEFRGEVNKAKIYDDYGHHPTEIKATLQGARELIAKRQAPSAKLYCVFQPHQYQRTHKLFEQFIGAFEGADEVIILPIFSVPGREKDSIKKKVSSEKLVKAMKENYELRMMNHGIKYISSFIEAKNYLKKNLRKGDVCLIMGAGDVYKLTEMILE